MNQLINGTEVLNLPYDLYATDEFDWTAVAVNKEYALDGTLIIERSTKKAGKPITLSADNSMAWLTRTELETLYRFASQKTTLYYKTDKGQVSVVFDDNPISATPVKGFVSPNDDDYFNVTIKLIQVQG